MSHSSPTLIAVADLLNGQLVHAQAGQRHQYQPLESALCPQSRLQEFIPNVKQTHGINHFYVADLNALKGEKRNPLPSEILHSCAERIYYDAGFSNVQDFEVVARVLPHIPFTPVLALETLTSLSEGLHCVDAFLCAGHSPVFSLDLMNGQPWNSNWTQSPIEIVSQFVSAGIRQMIVLEMSAVGTSRGLLTRNLCEEFKATFPQLSLLTGGGIRNWEDIQQVPGQTIDGLLVGTLLHQPDRFSQLNGQISHQ